MAGARRGDRHCADLRRCACPDRGARGRPPRPPPDIGCGVDRRGDAEAATQAGVCGARGRGADARPCRTAEGRSWGGLRGGERAAGRPALLAPTPVGARVGCCPRSTPYTLRGVDLRATAVAVILSANVFRATGKGGAWPGPSWIAEGRWSGGLPGDGGGQARAVLPKGRLTRPGRAGGAPRDPRRTPCAGWNGGALRWRRRGGRDWSDRRGEGDRAFPDCERSIVNRSAR